MASKTVSVDDFDGVSPAETVEYSWRGTGYEVDLSDENQSHYDDIMQELIKVSRKVSGGGGGKTRPAATKPAVTDTNRKEHLQKIRDYFEAKGQPINKRGRIPNALIKEYEADANNKLTPVGVG